mmetsp:Transcript_2177/g.3067  ORF Transcript_2177/g.3067 Transcript_2177/m.3067 type:complete len:93 (-) Transcript_2177:1432-1710(-)
MSNLIYIMVFEERILKKILYVRNLPLNIDTNEIYDLFSKYGRIFQIRIGFTSVTKGSCIIIYSTNKEASLALASLSGKLFKNKYLVILLFKL